VLVWDIRASPLPYYCSETSTASATTVDVKIQQTYAFDDSEQQFITTVRDGEDPTHDWGSYSDVDLAKWMERPILAGTYIWNVGEPFPVIYFNPWSAFLDSPSVAQKLSNFYLLRCKMCMKVIVNGSQMHYGRGIISYRPLMSEPGERFQFDPGTLFSNPFEFIGHDAASGIAVTGSQEVCLMTQSQWPKIFIDPGQSLGGEMCFPFFYGANWFRIPDRDWVANPSAVASGQEFVNPDGSYVQMLNGNVPNTSHGVYGCRASHMGVIHSSSLAPLKHANGADDPVTIQVFLWAEDVKLSIPTSVPHPEAAPLTSAISYTPHMRSEYVPNFLGDLAHSSAPDISSRLEYGSSTLATDAATVGIESSDEMSITHLAKRECWLDRFTWTVDSPAETPIWQCRVTPQYFRRQLAIDPDDRSSGIVAQQPAPSAYAALPFGYWRGSMKYRIQIVASNLHRGRLRIVYDPVVDTHARSDVTNYPEALMNLQYSRTIDIAGDSGRDFCFEVGYMQEKPYLPLLQLESTNGDGSNNYDWENYGPIVPTPGTARITSTSTTNGTITIYVLNRLAVPAQAPDLNNDVQVNVFVAGGDDLDFQMPTTRNLNQMSFVPPTGYPANWDNDAIPTAVGNEALRRKTAKKEAADKANHDIRFTPHMDAGGGESAAMGATEMENVPVDPPTKAWMGDCSQPPAPMAAVTFGESFKSWSALMNRWNLYNREIFCDGDREPVGFDKSFSILSINPDFPPFPGPSPMNILWPAFTNNNNQFASFPSYPYIRGTGGLDDPGDLARNAGVNIPPASKFFLNAPLRDVPNEDNPVDLATLLKVNPGELTILHFVSRMFIARKGAIKNKYILDGNDQFDRTGATTIFSAKRLPDSGVLSGNVYLTNTSSAQTALETNTVNSAYPAFGGFWSQAMCKLENGANFVRGRTPSLDKCQAVNGNTQTGAATCGAPNWFNPLVEPAAPPPSLNSAGPINTQVRGDLMLANTYDGVHVTTAKQQPVIEVEVPFYVNSRFVQNNLVMNNTRGVQAHVLRYETVEQTIAVPDVGEERAGVTYVERHVKPGADFALFYLVNVPHICLNASHIYSTTTNYPDPTVDEMVDCSYSKLLYACGTRQAQSAYRQTPPAGGVYFNTTGNDNYFYDLSIDAQAAPLNYPFVT
jgi:hypothetical protein